MTKDEVFACMKQCGGNAEKLTSWALRVGLLRENADGTVEMDKMLSEVVEEMIRDLKESER